MCFLGFLGDFYLLISCLTENQFTHDILVLNRSVGEFLAADKQCYRAILENLDRKSCLGF